jgi:fatty-acid peroxygenase
MQRERAARIEEAQRGLLPSRVAAVELLNVLRPTVAVAAWIVFAALALHSHAAMRARLADGDERFAEAFVQEVRRVYPFFPGVIARARTEFEWRGYRFPGGCMTILDLYGTDHDARAWDDPLHFHPERFLDAPPDPYAFVPQGGGDERVHHRCPGERVAVRLTMLAAQRLARLHYDVRPQDLAIAWRRLPAVPRTGFVMSGIRARQ